MNKKKSLRLTLSIALISFAALFSGCQLVSDVSESVGKTFYNPIHKDTIVGYNVTEEPVYEDKVVGHNITETKDADGKVVDTIKVPVIKRVIVRYESVKEPIIERVITGYEPNAAGQLLKAAADLIPIPGASTATGGLLGAGSIALLALERLRRKEQKLKKDAEDGKIKAEDATVSMEEKFHIAVAGGRRFLKTEEGKKSEEAFKKAMRDKAAEYGMAKEYKAAVNIAKSLT